MFLLISQSVRDSRFLLLFFFCQPNSSETAQQSFVNLNSYERRFVKMLVFTGNLDSILNP